MVVHGVCCIMVSMHLLFTPHLSCPRLMDKPRMLQGQQCSSPIGQSYFGSMIQFKCGNSPFDISAPFTEYIGLLSKLLLQRSSILTSNVYLNKNSRFNFVSDTCPNSIYPHEFLRRYLYTNIILCWPVLKRCTLQPRFCRFKDTREALFSTSGT